MFSFPVFFARSIMGLFDKAKLQMFNPLFAKIPGAEKRKERQQHWGCLILAGARLCWNGCCWRKYNSRNSWGWHYHDALQSRHMTSKSESLGEPCSPPLLEILGYLSHRSRWYILQLSSTETLRWYTGSSTLVTPGASSACSLTCLPALVLLPFKLGTALTLLRRKL